MARESSVKHPASTTTLLQTKLHQPHVTRQLVPRPQLWERLEQGLDGQLIIVAASAGYGKTTLISSWLENRAVSSGKAMPAAWLSLDEYDSDLGVFLRYCAAALSTLFPEACPETLALLQAPQQSPLATLINTLSNEIDTLPRDFILVLDDYHAIRGEAVPDMLVALTQHWPHRLHLIIVTRHNPALPLARLRAKGQLAEIRAPDLRFTSEETAEYFRRTLQRPLSPKVHAQLEQQTEGWIAGLHLATVALQQGMDAATLAIPGSVDSHITAYLLNEVLDQQPRDIQQFLLKTSVFERWCVPLCDQVVRAGPTDRGTQARLEWLERTNFFLIPLDDRREWFRYHHLLRDVLRRRALTLLGTDQIGDLHRQAAAWFAGQGLLEDALQHSLVARDFDQVARLMRDGFCEVLNQQDRATLERWLNLLPAEIIEQRAWLLMIKAAALHFAARMDALLKTVEQIETLIPTDATLQAEDDVPLLHGLQLLMLGQDAYFRNEFEHCVAYLQESLALLPEAWTYAHNGCIIYLGMNLQAMGQEQAAEQFLWKQHETLREKTKDSTQILVALCSNALQAGQLEQARQAGELALEQAQRFNLQLMSGWAHYFLGLIAYLWNDLETAVRHFSEIADRRFAIQARIARHGLVGLAHTQLAQGHLAGAGETVNLLRQYDIGVLGVETEQTRSLHAQLQFQQGDRRNAFRWADALSAEIPDQPLLWLHFEHLTKARLLLSRGENGDASSALHIIETFDEIAERTHNTRVKILLLILRAEALDQQGETDAALAALHHAIELARPGDMIRPFVDQGSRVQQLLACLSEPPVAHDFIRRLLAAFPEAESHSPQIISPPIEPLIEPLTPRELDVLVLMHERLSDKEIAQKLGISPDTVKRHSANLFGKLGVNKRQAAVAKAISLGILAAR